MTITEIKRNLRKYQQARDAKVEYMDQLSSIPVVQIDMLKSYIYKVKEYKMMLHSKKLMNRIDASLGILNEYHPERRANPDYPNHEFSRAVRNIIEATNTLDDDLTQAHKRASTAIIKEII